MKVRTETSWSVYIVECGDGSLYCGVATDVERRMKDHAGPRGARYVRAHGGVAKLLWTLGVDSRGIALRVELWIKKQSRSAKQAIICGAKLVPHDLLYPDTGVGTVCQPLKAAFDHI